MFQLTDNPNDGLSQMSSEWVLKNMPELTNVRFTMYGPGCMSNAICVAAQAVGEGLTPDVPCADGQEQPGGPLRAVRRGLLRTPSRGGAQWTNTWGAVGPLLPGLLVQQVHGEVRRQPRHDGPPSSSTSKRNGLLFPEGFFAQNRPEPLTVEDYLSARWIVKPVNLYDCDIPMCVTVAYLFTTAERAKDMKQKPVYILSHAESRPKYRGIEQTLDEVEESAASPGDAGCTRGAGITASDLSFENMYDGYTLFHQIMLEGLRYRGVQPGEALDFYQTDISIEGPNPVSPSGGNAGSGRTPHMDAHGLHSADPGEGGARGRLRQ